MASAVIGSAIFELAVDTSKYERGLRDAESQSRGVSGKISGAFSGVGNALTAPVAALGKFATGAGLAVFGVQQIAGAAGGLVSGLFSQNVALENARAQFMAITKDAGQTADILDMVRKRAAATPFALNEMNAAAAGLLPITKQTGVALEELVGQAEILAASNPAQGLEGAAFALREAVSGDFTSIIERFNLPRQYINQLKEEGVPNLEIVSRAMLEMGYDADLVTSLAGTATGRWSTFMDTLDNIKLTVMQAAFEGLSGALVGVQGWLDKNSERLTAFAELVGQGLASAVSFGISGLSKLIRLLSGPLVTGFGIVKTAFGAVRESAETFIIYFQKNFEDYNDAGFFAQLGHHAHELRDTVLDLANYVFPLVRDSVLTFIQAVSGDWQDGEGVRPLHSALGNFGTLLHDQIIPRVTELAGWITGTLIPAVGDLAGWFMDDALPAIQRFGETAETWIVETTVPAIMELVGVVRDDILPALVEFGDWFTTSGVHTALDDISAAFTTLSDTSIPILTFIRDNKDTVFAGLVGVITALGAALLTFYVPALIASTAATWASVTAHVAAAIAFAAAWAPLIIALAAVGVAAAVLYKAWDTNFLGIQDITHRVIDFIAPYISTAASTIQGALETALGAIHTAWNTVFPAIQSAVEFLWPYISTYVTTHITIVRTVIEGALTAIQAIWNTVFPAIQAAVEFLWPHISSIIGMHIAAARVAIDVAVTAISAIWNTVFPAIQTAVEILWPYISSMISTHIGTAQSAIEIALGIIETVWNTVWPAAQTTAETVWAAIVVAANLINDIKTTIETTLGAIQSIWNTGWDAVSTKVSGVWNGIISLFTTTKDAFVSAALAPFEAFRDTVVGIMDDAFEKVSVVWDKIMDLVDKIPSISIGGGIAEGSTGIAGLEGFVSPASGSITQTFGQNLVPGFYGPAGHTGVDIAAVTGSPIYASGAGMVTQAGWNGGYGNAVTIAHANGYSTLYGHMSQILAQSGQSVNAGALIGLVGSTGASTGPHLHLELRQNGVPINPAGIIPFAKGGIVGGPTVGLIGEAGPEAVVPLKDGMVPVNVVAIDATGPAFDSPFFPVESRHDEMDWGQLAAVYAWISTSSDNIPFIIDIYKELAARANELGQDIPAFISYADMMAGYRYLSTHSDEIAWSTTIADELRTTFGNAMTTVAAEAGKVAVDIAKSYAPSPVLIGGSIAQAIAEKYGRESIANNAGVIGGQIAQAIAEKYGREALKRLEGIEDNTAPEAIAAALQPGQFVEGRGVYQSPGVFTTGGGGGNFGQRMIDALNQGTGGNIAGQPFSLTPKDRDIDPEQMGERMAAAFTDALARDGVRLTHYGNNYVTPQPGDDPIDWMREALST